MVDYDNVKIGKQNRNSARERAEKNRKDFARMGQPPQSAHKDRDLIRLRDEAKEARKAKGKW